VDFGTVLVGPLCFGDFYTVFALVIHRAWSKLGFKIWTWLAWLITFNFINIAWVFFRAKEWGDAVKVLGSMFSLDNVVLPEKLESKLYFLSNYGVKFGQWAKDITGSDWTMIWLIIGFILILVFKNSIEKLDIFKLNYKTALFSGFIFFMGLVSLNKVSEFLYFNF
jgi:hypothetical protein